MYKKIITIFLLCIYTALFVGCETSSKYTNTGDRISEAEENDEHNKNIEVLHIWPEHKETMDKTIEMYESSYPGVTISTRIVTWDRLTETLSASIMAKDTPDVSVVWPQSVKDWVRIDAVLEITDNVSNIDSIMWNPYLLKDCSFNGQTYAVPFRGTFDLIYYNSDMFQKYNLSPPRTIKEFEKICEFFKSIDISPLAAWGKPACGIPIRALWQDYAVLQGKEDKLLRFQVPMTDDIYVEAYDRVAQWYKKGYITHDIATMTRDDSQREFLAQRSAMLIGNNNEYSSIIKPLTFKVSVTQFPTLLGDGQQSSHISTDAFSVLKNTKYPYESLEFIKFLVTPKIQQLWMENTYSLPVIKGLKTSDDGLTQIMDIASSMNGRIIGQDNSYRELIDFKNPDIVDFVTGKRKYADRAKLYEDVRVKVQKTN